MPLPASEVRQLVTRLADRRVGRTEEAQYLTAILNSDVLTQLVRPLQARGEHNPRDFDKYIFQKPIPLYDPGNSEHRQLAELAKRAEEATAALELPPGVSFQAQRRRIREALSSDGLGGEINNLTSTLLAVAGGCPNRSPMGPTQAPYNGPEHQERKNTPIMPGHFGTPN